MIVYKKRIFKNVDIFVTIRLTSKIGSETRLLSTELVLSASHISGMCYISIMQYRNFHGYQTKRCTWNVISLKQQVIEYTQSKNHRKSKKKSLSLLKVLFNFKRTFLL